ncbi:hypothetical protein CLOM_g15252 [Closterium sp. NIES-68]|nr:hypothetical protein CLOM_g15252 [Closterium sp. NIES-68]
MYIRDLRNTKGHIAGLTAAQWHPCERHTALTGSEDGSLRIWDVRDFKTQKKVVKPKLARPGRVPVTAAEWGPDGRMVAAGLNDGSLQVWSVKAGGARCPTCCAWTRMRGVTTSRGSPSAPTTLVSRSMDSTMKVWDLRKFKQPVKVYSHLPNHYQQTNVAWSPDERLFFTGTSAEKGGRGGQLHFYSKESLDLVRVTGVSERCQGAVARQAQPAIRHVRRQEGGRHAHPVRPHPQRARRPRVRRPGAARPSP